MELIVIFVMIGAVIVSVVVMLVLAGVIGVIGGDLQSAVDAQQQAPLITRRICWFASQGDCIFWRERMPWPEPVKTYDICWKSPYVKEACQEGVMSTSRGIVA